MPKLPENHLIDELGAFAKVVPIQIMISAGTEANQVNNSVAWENQGAITQLRMPSSVIGTTKGSARRFANTAYTGSLGCRINKIGRQAIWADTVTATKSANQLGIFFAKLSESLGANTSSPKVANTESAKP